MLEVTYVYVVSGPLGYPKSGGMDSVGRSDPRFSISPSSHGIDPEGSIVLIRMRTGDGRTRPVMTLNRALRNSDDYLAIAGSSADEYVFVGVVTALATISRELSTIERINTRIAKETVVP